MSNIIIVFASMSGNTEEMAEAIAQGIKQEGESPIVKFVDDCSVSELLSYKACLLGAYTWGDGDLPDEFLDFYDDLDTIELNGKKAAVFGSCDSFYNKVGAAVDILIDKLSERGAEVVLPGLKVELTPTNEDIEVCKEFGRKFARSVTHSE
ncbi:flavodoxin [Fervidibacillus albus]|uniref:Flavodoxin n=1 Tax=Fervidibacillus albus TaxID=2980026 RepID=A0A9E8LWX2_9BACI|nr:flavodoxin [Fervidibacillus albus]WAA11170.1 flavodoxin [Fervidibacillus albus]